MGRRARIVINGERIMDGQREAVDMSAPGDFYRRDGKCYLLYEETTEDRHTARSLVKVSPDRLEIIKTGEIKSHMVFCRGERTETVYGAFAGQLTIGIHTRRLEIREREEELKVLVEYSMEMNGQSVSDSILTITVSFRGELEAD